VFVVFIVVERSWYLLALVMAFMLLILKISRFSFLSWRILWTATSRDCLDYK